MIKRIALVFGIVFLLVGIAGYLTEGGMSMQVEPAALLLGLFPVNMLHNAVHVAFGLWGIVASRSFAGARNYARIGGVIYALLAVLGFVVPNGFGLVPLGGHDIWLHAVLGIALLAAGFTAKDEVVVAPTPTRP
jgi:hypothetical protein